MQSHTQSAARRLTQRFPKVCTFSHDSRRRKEARALLVMSSLYLALNSLTKCSKSTSSKLRPPRLRSHACASTCSCPFLNATMLTCSAHVLVHLCSSWTEAECAADTRCLICAGALNLAESQHGTSGALAVLLASCLEVRIESCQGESSQSQAGMHDGQEGTVTCSAWWPMSTKATVTGSFSGRSVL